MNGTQCDTCRRFSEVSVDWFFLVRVKPAVPGLFSAIYTNSQEAIGCFCSAGCLADYSYTLAVALEKPKEAAG